MTVDEVRILLWKYATTDPNDGDGQFLASLNQAAERIHSEGIWQGLKLQIDLSPYVDLADPDKGLLTLPYEYEGVLAMQIDDSPVMIVDEAVEYTAGGYGERTGGGGGGVVIDNGFVLTNGQLLRQYKITQAVNDGTGFRGLVKRRFVYMVDGCSTVYPNNIGALKQALLAINFEDQNDPERAKVYWDECYKILNSAASSSRTGSNFPVAAKLFGLGGYNVRGIV